MQPTFRILGPLEVALAERARALGRRERALLGVLLLNAGDVISVERLIDGVWGEARPASAKHMVHEYVSRLRVALGDASRIETRVPGYVVVCGDEELDSRLFAGLAAAARACAAAGDHSGALRSFDDALGLWRGDALADELEGDARTDAARLDDERRLVGEQRIDSALALGRHRELISELERHVRDEPLRERQRAQLMLALYRSGRQTDALARYREGRELLVEHAGVEPGHELRRLERAILQHDPALELVAPAQAHVPGAPTAVTARRGRRSRGFLAGALAAAVAAAAATAIVLATGGSGSPPALASVRASAVGAIDPGSGRLIDQVRVGAGPGRMVAGFGSLWVVNDFDNTVSRIDPGDGSVRTIRVDSDPTAIAVGQGSVWVASAGARQVDRIDPALDRITKRVDVGSGPSGIAFSPGRMWIANRIDGTVTEVDATSGRRGRTLDAGVSPSDIAYGFGALWIANESASTVTRLDPATGGIEAARVGSGPESVAIGAGSVWVANSLDRTVSRINPATVVQAAAIPVGSGPSALLSSNGSIWVADSYGGRIDRIDPEANSIVDRTPVGSAPQSLAAIDGRIWLSARATAPAHRGGTLRMSDYIPQHSLDPADGETRPAWSIFTVIGDGLVGLKGVGGLDGDTLVPDLARAIPEPTDGGRTYTFHLRRGIRYSDGEPLRASDFRRALERDVRLGSPGEGYDELFSGELVGGDACSKAHCDLARGIVTDDRRGIVTLHLRQADPDLLEKLTVPFAEPVPPGISMANVRPFGVPGTGPYMVASFTPAQHLTLIRNPFFQQWSAEAQPDGYPDRIVLSYTGSRGQQLAAVEAGRADVMEDPPAGSIKEIAARHADQVRVFPASTIFALVLNTALPPFSVPAARRALNLAIDRGKAVSQFGGRAAATATCQILPIGMAGYRQYCPYTRGKTGTDVVWAGPDLQRARSLVAASGTKGAKVVFWTGVQPLELIVGRLAFDALEKLGYDVTVKHVPGDGYFGKLFDSRNHVQAGFMAWTTDYPTPSDIIPPLFTCSAFHPATAANVAASELCDPALDSAVRTALAKQDTDTRRASNARWAHVDKLVTDLAPWVPLVNAQEVLVVSRRVGNVQSNATRGTLFDQIWVR